MVPPLTSNVAISRNDGVDLSAGTGEARKAD